MNEETLREDLEQARRELGEAHAGNNYLKDIAIRLFNLWEPAGEERDHWLKHAPWLTGDK